MEIRKIILLIGLTALLPAPFIRAAEVSVSLKGKSFPSEAIHAKPGDTIVFRNDETDGTSHSLYSITPGYEFDLKIQKPGETKRYPIPASATSKRMEVRCAVHENLASEKQLAIEIMK